MLRFACLESIAAIVIGVLFGCSLVARADDSSVYGVGGNLRMMHENKSIRMASEVVKITNLPDGKVDATFWLQNTGGPTDVTIGFPGYGYNDSPLLTHFQSQVDGAPVKVKLVRSKTTEEGQDDQAWFTKKVHFDAGQTHVVRDLYTGGGGDNAMGQRWYTYYMHTGASWKGSIGHAMITADVSGLAAYSIASIKPAHSVRRGSTITWTFTNLKPSDDDDITISYVPGFVKFVVNGQPIWGSDPGQLSFGGEGNISLRRGNDAFVSVRYAEQLLSANIVVVKKNRTVQLVRGKRWVQLTVGSRMLVTSAGKSIALPAPVELAHGAAFYGDNQNQYIASYLKPIALGLGGKATMAGDRMYVNMPAVEK